MQAGLKPIKRRQKFLETFKGLCLRPVTPEGYFRDDENVSSDGYPTIIPRKARGVITNCGNITAMFDHTKMLWLSGTTLYYGEEAVGELTAGEKQFASLGAYIVIYPDKKIFNTETLELDPIENEVMVSNADVYASNADGTRAAGTNYTTISCSGIGVGFKDGDGVSISGAGGLFPDGDYLIQSVDENRVVIIHALDAGGKIETMITVRRHAPDLDFICALNNRIWGCSDKMHMVCASKLGDATNWNVFQGISTDSYQAIIPSPGPFTGLTSDLGSVIFFKEEEIIRLFGNKPSNFQLTSYKMPGVEAGSGKSIAYLESALFYKGLTGVYVYDGGIPECISVSLGARKYSSARAGGVNGKYYISMLDEEAGAYRLFVYDTRTGAWHKESGGEIEFFLRSGDEMYFKGANGDMYTVNGGKMWYDAEKLPSNRFSFREMLIKWYFETGAMSLSMPSRQYVTHLHVRYALKKDAVLLAEIKYREEDGYTTAGFFSDETEEGTFTLPVPVKRSDSIRLRFSGEGEATVISIGQTFEEGSFF